MSVIYTVIYVLKAFIELSHSVFNKNTKINVKKKKYSFMKINYRINSINLIPIQNKIEIL